MNSASELRGHLQRIDGRSYRAYKDIEGEYQFPNYVLAIDHAQGDPFAAPSRIRLRVAKADMGMPEDLLATAVSIMATEDFLARRAATTIRRVVKGHRGIGHSGAITIDSGGQEVISRTACKIGLDYVELRLSIGLPAAGRTVLGAEAAAMFFDELPRIVEASLFYRNLDKKELARHVATVEDQEDLRSQLEIHGLVAFIADGAVLPRASGASDLPLTSAQVVRFQAPPELRVELRVPHRGVLESGVIKGAGIPKGVTLIVGGGYHGKSTVLNALSRGVYPHIPLDGREYVVTRGDAVKVRAEDGRSVQKVDISPFITDLPFGTATSAFSTENASGSTSQAANIIEALESGSKLLLVDEDTSATNFMIRDARMQRLVPNEREPITPFVDQVQAIYKERGVSTLLVIGGSGDYFDVADQVIAMYDYQPSVVTKEAKRIAGELPTQRAIEAQRGFAELAVRAVVSQSLDPVRRGRVKVRARGTKTIEFGQETIELAAVEQLVEASQTEGVANVLLYGLEKGYFDLETPLHAAVARIYDDIAAKGIEVISQFRGGHPGDYSLPRPQEAIAALNRLRSLRIQQVGP